MNRIGVRQRIQGDIFTLPAHDPYGVILDLDEKAHRQLLEAQKNDPYPEVESVDETGKYVQLGAIWDGEYVSFSPTRFRVFVHCDRSRDWVKERHRSFQRKMAMTGADKENVILSRAQAAEIILLLKYSSGLAAMHHDGTHSYETRRTAKDLEEAFGIVGAAND